MLDQLIDLLLPRGCLGCAAPGPGLCRRCARPDPVHRHLRVVGPVCGGAAYGGGVRMAVVHFKDRDRRDLLPMLSVLLAAAVTELLAQAGVIPSTTAGVALVPVRSTRRAARLRGGDHMVRLARAAAADRGWSVHPALSLTRAVRDAAGLGLRERAENIAGAFAAVPPDAFGPVSTTATVLVDDVLTTGATLREAARALTGVGWPLIGAAVIGVTPRRRPP